MTSLEVIALESFPLVRPGDNLIVTVYREGKVVKLTTTIDR